jgi:rSAM/selenodomain-associated transferase 1
VGVFAKAPVPGGVKTRLEGLLGREGAAALHAELVRHTLSTAVASGVGAVELWCAPDALHPFFQQCAREFGVTLRVQEGADLGLRMARAFEASHAENRALVVIGTDCPALDAAAIVEAAEALRTHDAVVRPAEDGGYVLVGLATPVAGLFDAIAWGGDAVMEVTRARLARAGIRWKELDVSWDVDRPEDYARLTASGLLRQAPA